MGGFAVEVRSYQELRVWQMGMELVRDVYRLSQRFPEHERYGLTSQMRRAAVSIPANIAEVHARESTKEFLRHVSIALGSLAELETFLMLCDSLGYCDESGTAEVLNKCDQEGRMLRTLQKRLKAKCSS